MPSGAHKGRKQYYIITIISWLYNNSSFWLYHIPLRPTLSSLFIITQEISTIEANSRTHSLFALRIFCGWYYTNNVNDGVCGDDEIAENVKKQLKSWQKSSLGRIFFFDRPMICGSISSELVPLFSLRENRGLDLNIFPTFAFIPVFFENLPNFNLHVNVLLTHL